MIELMVSPTLRRKRLARLLRELRDQAGLTIDEAADRLDISRSALSRAENALVGVKPMLVRELARAYEADDGVTEKLVDLARDGNKKGWWQDFTSVLTDGDTTYIGFEEEASSIQSYQTLLVPGILQTPDYARAIFRAYKDTATPEQIDRRVSVRLRRQERLKDLQFWAILEEGAICRRVGSPTILREQLERLLSVSQQPNVTLQILPFEIGAYPGYEGSFSVMHFPDERDPTVVYAETPAGEVWLERPDQVKPLIQRFEHLRAAARSPHETTTMLEAALATLA